MEEWTIQNIFSKCQTSKFWNIFLPKNLANDFIQGQLYTVTIHGHYIRLAISRLRTVTIHGHYIRQLYTVTIHGHYIRLAISRLRTVTIHGHYMFIVSVCSYRLQLPFIVSVYSYRLQLRLQSLCIAWLQSVKYIWTLDRIMVTVLQHLLQTRHRPSIDRLQSMAIAAEIYTTEVSFPPTLLNTLAVTKIFPKVSLQNCRLLQCKNKVFLQYGT